MSDQAFVDGLLAMMREAVEGGKPGEGTGFMENTKADGSGNHGLLPTMASLTAAQASAPTALGTSVAAHCAHVAYHLEVTVRWVNGDRGPFDWKGSFEPRVVNDAEWKDRQARVRAAYEGVVALARSTPEWNDDAAGGIAATLAHLAYHVGAVRQIVKLAV